MKNYGEKYKDLKDRIQIISIRQCFIVGFVCFHRRFGVGMVGSISGILFVVFRSAIFDGTLLASWSPLAIDDASFTTHLVIRMKSFP